MYINIYISKTDFISKRVIFRVIFRFLPNLPQDEGLAFLKGFFGHSRFDKQVITDTLIKLAELVLKNSIYEFSDKTCYIVCYTILTIVFAILTTYFFIWEMVKNFLKNL